jgi:O-antigen/teichoic acid export membrane protein
MASSRSASATFQAESRRAFRNMVAKAISVPVERAGRLLLVVVAAPKLGQSAFGNYQLVATATALLMLATEMGLGVWTTRVLARSPSRAALVVGTALRRRGRALGVYATVIGALAFASGRGESRALYFWLALGALTNAAVDYTAAVFRGFERLEDEAQVNVARAFLVAAGGIAALQWRSSASAFAAGTAAGGVVAVCLAVAILRSHYGLLRGPGVVSRDPELARSAAAEGLPLWAITAVTLLYSRGDILLMRLYLGTSDIGAYSAADKVFESLNIVTGVVLAALFPPLARSHGNHEAERRWEALLVGLLLACGVAAGALLYAESVPIVSLIYGRDFAQASAPLRVLGLASPVLFLNYALTHILIARNLERRNLLFAGLALAVNVTSNVVLLPRLGATGAAWGTLATELTMTACCLGVLWRRWAAAASSP